MKFTDTTNVVIHDMHRLNCKSFHISVFRSQGVQLYNVNIMAPGDNPNTDGIHISSSANINITTSTIGVGDDCVSIGEGNNDIFVSGIFCGPGHGIRMLIGLGGIGKNGGKMMKQDKSDLWINGLIFTYEFVNGNRWTPIGWDQISKYVQKIQVPYNSTSQSKDPMWWCHINGGHQSIKECLSNATWLDFRAIIALRERGHWIGNYTEHLGYELPVTVGGGLLLEMLEHSVPDIKWIGETSVKLRCFHAQNFLVSSLHTNSSPSNGRVLSITEVQELLSAGGGQVPKSIHEIIAHLLARFSCWDDRCNKALKEAPCVAFDTEIRNL